MLLVFSGFSSSASSTFKLYQQINLFIGLSLKLSNIVASGYTPRPQPPGQFKFLKSLKRSCGQRKKSNQPTSLGYRTHGRVRQKYRVPPKRKHLILSAGNIYKKRRFLFRNKTEHDGDMLGNTLCMTSTTQSRLLSISYISTSYWKSKEKCITVHT